MVLWSFYGGWCWLFPNLLFPSAVLPLSASNHLIQGLGIVQWLYAGVLTLIALYDINRTLSVDGATSGYCFGAAFAAFFGEGYRSLSPVGRHFISRSRAHRVGLFLGSTQWFGFTLNGFVENAIIFFLMVK